MIAKGFRFTFCTNQLSESIYFYRDVLECDYLGAAEGSTVDESALFALNEQFKFEVYETPGVLAYRGFAARVVVEVDDVDALCQRIRAKGWTGIIHMWTWHFGHRKFSVVDPDGIMIDFYTVVSDERVQNEEPKFH